MIDVPIVLLPDSSCTAVDDCELDQNIARFELYMHMTSPTSPCPLCQQSAHRVHSRYQRKLADLPWAGIPVRIYLSTASLLL